MEHRGIIVAGTHSGAGKTTVALGLIDLFRRKGLDVQPFKVGPDFIDPSLHALMAGKPSRNLDSFLLKPQTLRRLYANAAERADLAVIEGVGGIYDGYSGRNGRGSTGEIAEILTCPVLLVCDAKSSARSLAAVVKGFVEFNPKIKFSGIFLNRLASRKHLEWCRQAIRQASSVPVLGWLFTAPQIEMKERHMGLIPAAEKKFSPVWLRELRRQMDAQVDWKRLIAGRKNRFAAPLHMDMLPAACGVRVGVARDAAFSFYYQDNLDLLERLGAEIVPFSPMSDVKLPRDLHGLYFGGGFPEVYGRQLQANRRLRAEIADRVRRGVPTYGECGGLMYLGDSITNFEGENFRMVGAFPYRTEMTSKISMAYIHASARRGNLLSCPGDRFPGQVFHFSRLRPARQLRYAYRLSDGYASFPDGVAAGNALASYLHLHFWSKPSLAANFVRRCAKWGARAEA